MFMVVETSVTEELDGSTAHQSEANEPMQKDFELLLHPESPISVTFLWSSGVTAFIMRSVHSCHSKWPGSNWSAIILNNSNRGGQPSATVSLCAKAAKSYSNWEMAALRFPNIRVNRFRGLGRWGLGSGVWGLGILVLAF